MTIGERIFKYRKQAGLSQEELADKMNVTRQSISLWETDQTTPSLDSLIMLAEIFAVSLDELCGTQPTKDVEPVSSNVSEKSEEYLAYAETKYTVDLIKHINKLSSKKFFIIGVIAIICSIFMGIGIIVSNTDNAVLVIPIFIIAVISASFVRQILSFKKRTADFFKLRSNCVAKIKLYQDRLCVESTSDNTDSKSTLPFGDIKKIKNTGNYILIYFDNTVVPIEKNLPDINYELILKLLNVPLSDTSAPQNKKVKVFLLTMFIVSLLSIFMAMITTAIVNHFSPLPDYPYSLPEYMWILFVFIPLPLASAVLGIVFLAKKYRCKKNIIAGFIMSAVLSTYGSFPFMYKDQAIHDFNYVMELEQTIGIDLPDSGYISYTLDLDQKTNSMAMIKFDNKNEIFDIVTFDERFYRGTNLIPSNFVPIYYFSLTSDYSYFMLFDVTCNEANNVINGIHEQHRFIFIAYNDHENILFTLDFVK